MADADYRALLGEALKTALASEMLGLDKRAREALAELSASQQKAIIEDINPEACRNPSAVAIKKIMEMKSAARLRGMGGMGGLGGLGGLGGMGGIGDFGSMGGRGLKRSRADSLGLDEKAKEALAGLPEWQQRAVIEDINPEVCRNPSAVAIKKIREIKSSGGMGISPETSIASEILGLDERAREALAGLSASKQKAVIEDINPEVCRNPSAVAIAKVTQMKSLGGMGRMGGSSNYEGPPRTVDSLGLDDKALEALGGLSESQQKAVIEDINPEVVRNPSAVVIKKIREIKFSGGMGISLESEVAADQLGVDDRAKEALGTLTNIQQQMVLKTIIPGECRNPSALVIKKIMDIKQGRNIIMGTDYGMTTETNLAAEVLGLDEKAREALAELSGLEQKAVIEEINPDACRNPSAVVIKKITEIRGAKGKGGKGGVGGVMGALRGMVMKGMAKKGR